MHTLFRSLLALIVVGAAAGAQAGTAAQFEGSTHCQLTLSGPIEGTYECHVRALDMQFMVQAMVKLPFNVIFLAQKPLAPGTLSGKAFRTGGASLMDPKGGVWGTDNHEPSLVLVLDSYTPMGPANVMYRASGTVDAELTPPSGKGDKLKVHITF